jgi:hypothetical protein
VALRVFGSVYEAKRAGFEVYDRSPVVFLVRKKNPNAPLGWELAAVQLNAAPKPNE